MKSVALTPAIKSSASGLIAAYKWYVASRVDIVAFEQQNGHLVKVAADDAQVWIGALRATVQKSGRLNSSAAVWTAFSVALAGLSVIFSATC